MKLLTMLLVGVLLFSACKKEEYGNTRQKVRVTTDAFSGNFKSSKLKSLQSENGLRYTQFGDFITSITPKSFIGKLTAVRFHDDTIQGNLGGNFMTVAGLSVGDITADFTSNATISVIPVLNGNLILNPDGQGASFKEKVTFKFLWVSMNLTQDIELPMEYSNVELRQFYPMFSKKNGNVLTTELKPLFEPVNELNQLNNGLNVYFGMTDHTFIEEGTILGNALGRYIRSSHFEEWIMIPPLPEQTKTYISTIGFPNDNIIQIYAGADNLPYTADDIIVMEPNFWERIYVTVSEE
jgi:hypothetical protein